MHYHKERQEKLRLWLCNPFFFLAPLLCAFQDMKSDASVLANKLSAESARADDLQQKLDAVEASLRALEHEKQEVGLPVRQMVLKEEEKSFTVIGVSVHKERFQIDACTS